MIGLLITLLVAALAYLLRPDGWEQTVAGSWTCR